MYKNVSGKKKRTKIVQNVSGQKALLRDTKIVQKRFWTKNLVFRCVRCLNCCLKTGNNTKIALTVISCSESENQQKKIIALVSLKLFVKKFSSIFFVVCFFFKSNPKNRFFFCEE